MASQHCVWQPCSMVHNPLDLPTGTCSQLCVRSMASLDTIGPLVSGMKVRADMVGLACEALNRMFQKEQTDLVAQVPPPPHLC